MIADSTITPFGLMGVKFSIKDCNEGPAGVVVPKYIYISRTPGFFKKKNRSRNYW